MALRRQRTVKMTVRTKDGWADKEVALRDVGPSSQQQSGMRVDWRHAYDALGHPFASRLSINQCYEVRNDAMVNFGLMFTKAPLVRLNWYIQCNDAQVAAFVDNCLREIYAQYVMQYTNSFDFGWSAIQKRFKKFYPDWMYVDPRDPTSPEKKVWDAGPVAAMGWRPFITFRPEVVNPVWTEDGEFNGFQWGKTAPIPNDNPQEDNHVDLYHALWVTNNKDREFGSLWGSSRLVPASKYWWSYWFRWTLGDRAFERSVDPALAIFYPDQVIMEDGEEVTLESAAMAAGNDLRAGSTVTFPNTYLEDENGRPIAREWDFKAMENNTKFADLQASFEYLDIMKLRAVLVPEQALIEGKGGTSSRNVATEMNDSFDESQAVTIGEIAFHLNNYVIPQIVALNFPERQVTARFVPRGFSSADRDLAQQLIQLIGQDDPGALGVDAREILRTFGIPILSPEAAQKMWEQKLDRQQQVAEMEAQASNSAGGLIDPNASPEQNAAQGETVPSGSSGVPQTEKKTVTAAAPKGGTTAGQGKLKAAEHPEPLDDGSTIINEQGQYVQPRERIVLSDSFGERLRIGTHFFDSPDPYEAVDHIREIMQRAFSDAYAHAADRIEEVKLDGGVQELAVQLGPIDLARKVLALIGNTYLVPYRTAMRSITNTALKLMNASAKHELQKIGLDPAIANQRPAKAAMRRWLDDRLTYVLSSIDKTTRDELETFIANASMTTDDPKAIAEMAKQHFSTFPDWKADRIARTEGRLAYNAGFLLAGQIAGCDWAQASDASDGTNRTDEECMNRHGKLFRIEDAIKEDALEHPNGTLGWKLRPVLTTDEEREVANG